jgi:hypothetical protein
MRKTYRKIIPMRLKFAAASATGRTRCGEFVDQKDERKPIGRDQRPETSGRKMESENFLLLPSNYLGAQTRHAEVQTSAEASCEGG